MRYLLAMAAAALAVLQAPAAHAQRPTCRLQAIEKKLGEPARSNFMRKCASDVETYCEQTAAERKLEGPARTLFIKRCTGLYVG
jgi:hypothetical protein